jgi:hypothetical protein
MLRIKDIAIIAILSLTLLCVTSLGIAAQEEEDEKPSYSPRHYPFNLSLWYPISINRTPHDSANINLTLLYGRIGTVRGLDLAIGASIQEDGLYGVQIAALAGVSGRHTSGLQVNGLVSVTGNDISGAQISGLINVVGESGAAFQAAGLANIAGNRLQGFQASGLFNVVGERLQGAQAVGGFNVVGNSCVGFQAAGLFNVTGEGFVGLQAAGLFNVTGNNFKGLQAAGLFNVVGDDLTGAQIGIFNVAPHFTHAAQIGIFNVSAEMRGFQLGLVNWNGETHGIPVGLVNVSKRDGRIRWINWGSNLSGINSGVKFEVGKIYSIVALGYWNFQKDKGSGLSYQGYYGMMVYEEDIAIGVDVGYMYMDNKQIFKSNLDAPDQNILMGRIHVSHDISSQVSLIGGAGLSYIADRHQPFGDGKFRPLFFLGIEIF